MLKLKKILPSLALVTLFSGVLLLSSLPIASAAESAAITPDGSQINYGGTTFVNSGLTDTNDQALYVPSNFTCGGKVIVVNSADESYTALNTEGSGGLGSDCSFTTGGEVTLNVYKVENEEDCTDMGAAWISGSCRFTNETDATEFIQEASGAAGELNDEEATCEDSGGEFSFFLCPALRIATSMFEVLDSRIRSSLEVKPKYFQDSDLKEAWGRIRNVAYVLLIPVMLMMVIGTALGFSFLDAYTVKRALPRMFAAIIFMAVSFDVCRILIEVTNGVGSSLGGLIAQPFGGLNELRLQNIFDAGALAGGGSAVGGALGVVVLFAVGALSLGILASYFFTASLALLIVFVILTIRELIIIFLIVLAPLAILSWIFPGNDKMWKLWWGTFSKLLFLYPIIVALLVTGRAFAKISGTLGASGIEGVFIIIVKLTAYVGPFFFIPKAFQYAGGAFGNLAGMVNDRGKGLFDRQRKYRADSMKKNRERIAAGNAVRPTGWVGKTRVGKAINNRGADVYDIKNAVARDGVIRGLSKTGKKDSADRRRIHEEGAAAKDEVLARKGLNDNFLHMLEMVMKGESDEAMIVELVNNGYNLESAKLAVAQGKNMYDQYGHGLGKIISDGKAASKTSQTDNFAEHLANIWSLSHGDEGMMMELIGSGSAAFNQAGRLSMSGGSYGEKAAMAKAFANVGPGGRYNGPATVTYFDEIKGENQTIDFSAAMGDSPTMTIEDVINTRQRQKARDSFGTWDWSRIHPTDVKSVMKDLHSSVNETSAQLRDQSLSAPERQKKERALGQQISQLHSLRQNAMQTGNDEVKRIVAEAYDAETPVDITVGNKPYKTLGELVHDTDIVANGGGTKREAIVDENGVVTGERIVRDPNLPTIPDSVLSGYSSVKVAGGLTPEQMEQMRQQNAPK